MKTYVPTRVEDGDPDQCLSMGKHGQCRFKRVPGGNHCEIHGGNKIIESQNKKSLNLYRLSKWEARIRELSLPETLKSLNEEMGILRIMLEERVNACTSATQLVLNSAGISELIVKIRDTAKVVHNLDVATGKTLDKTALTQFASEIISILSKHVDPDTLSLVADDLEEALERVGGTLHTVATQIS